MRLLAFNIIGYIFVVLINFLANYLPINGKRTGEISDSLPVLFTPAGYVFSIWLLIYVLLGIWVLRQIPKSRRNDPVYKVSFPWFLLTCLFNGSWILVWHYELFTLSVIVMIALLLSLIILYTKIKSVEHTWMDIAPFSIYLGWISVATITNIAFVLTNIGWNGFGLSDPVWTIIMMFVAAILAITFRIKNHDWLYPLVFVWSFIGIASKNSDLGNGIPIFAYSLAALIFIVSVYPWKR